MLIVQFSSISEEAEFFQNVLFLTAHNLTICYMMSSAKVYLMILSDVLSIASSGCSFESWSHISLLHVFHPFMSVLLLGVFLAALTLPRPLRIHPLHTAKMAWCISFLRVAVSKSMASISSKPTSKVTYAASISSGIVFEFSGQASITPWFNSLSFLIPLDWPTYAPSSLGYP
jgi:hypothetical protein